ncbi:hypothetical protein N7486_004412 [Penicillium sp. IBT 16267x]|nr:hypothetical protein N7486_004412 [Penicillium sp. IBT 16267x]
MAGYPSDSVLLHSNFFRQSVAPSLGPHPRGHGDCDNWKSFMTDDNTPVELSWCWSTSLETPTVRYSADPIGKFAGQKVDPINTAASLQAATVSKCTNPRTRGNDIAFDLLESSIVVKQYYLPGWKALAEGKSKPTVVEEALKKLSEPANALLSSFEVLNDFIKSFPEQSQPTMEIVAIDCLDPAQSRLKIYFRSQATTLHSVWDILTLGGRAPKTPEEKDSFRELWCSVFGLNQNEYKDHQPLLEKRHRTGGILYYFEMKKGATVPKSKVYLPVRHYAQNDDQISRGLSKYLAGRGKRLATGSYYDGAQRLWYVRWLFSLIKSLTII